MEHFLTAFATILFDPAAIAIFVAALLGGLVFGAIPGLNAITLAAILLPFTAFMNPAYAIMMFGVMYVAGVYGGAVTAILFNIPGSENNAPTAFDGYPMTLKGESGRAIGAAVICSAIGGLASAVLMMVGTEPLARWAVRAFGPPEVLALVIFGLSVAGTVGSKSAVKGWISVSIGLLVSTIGLSPGGGIPRFTFDSMFLMGGIQFVSVLLGVFAFAEILSQGHSRTGIQKGNHSSRIDFPSVLEFWRLRIAIIRSMLIGFFAGLLPGIGATLAAFVGYSEAVRWSRHPERFGKGEIEGVVSSETANNAATGVAMIPLLALGIPGGAMTAMMLAAFQMHGIDPGPALFRTNIDLVWIVFVGMLLANFCIFGLGYLETRTVVHLLKIPFGILAPIILMLATIGAYAVRNSMLDVWAMFVAGFVGFLMRKSGYSMAGLVLGVILGKVGEGALVKAMPLVRYDLINFMQRPICFILIVSAVVLLGLSIRRSIRDSRLSGPVAQ